MARSLNRAQIIGNLGQDPEIRSTPSGKSVCTISVATTESYKDSNGEWKDITEWHRVDLWERLADVAGQYLKKGSKVFIEGRIRTDSYEKDGITKYSTKIVASNMIMMGSREDSEGGPYTGGSQPTKANDSGYDTARPKINDNDLDTDDSDDVPF